MVETIYKFNNSDEKMIEQLINDGNLALNHVILKNGDGIPEHFSNSNVYLILINGTLTIKLGEQEAKRYGKGEIVQVPYNVKMNIYNSDDEELEFFILKSPNPKHYGRK